MNSLFNLDHIATDLSRFYDLKRTAEVKEMIFDFLETVDKFCYETELAEVA